MSALGPLWLPLAVAALAVLVLLADLAGPATDRPRRELGALVVLGLAAIGVASFFVAGAGSAASGAYEGGPYTLFYQRIFLAAGALGALGAIDDVAARTPRRQGEYWLLLLASLTGMVFLAGARDLVLLIVSFELMGAPLYVLAAFAKTDAEDPGAPRTRAAEAALKLYLVGATSTAVTLFGLALLTGMAGTTRLAAVGATPMTPLSAVALVLVLAGLGYKLGVAPFHMWVPDTYQGARLPFVAFLSVAPKAAGAVAVISIFTVGLGPHRATWAPPLAVGALLSMAIGNVLALPQTDLRRLLGYSGVAQIGYALLAVTAGDRFGLGMASFFLATYVFTNLGAFLAIHAATERGGDARFEGLYGLWSRAPGVAVALGCSLLSLAGIPFMVGFWSKLYVLLAAWRAGLGWLVAAGIVLGVAGLFYYLRVLRAAYMTDPIEGAPTPTPGPALRLALAISALAVVGLGLYPAPLFDAAVRAGSDALDAPARAVEPLRAAR